MGPPGPGGGFLVEKAKKPPWPEWHTPYPPFGLFLRGSSLPGPEPPRKGPKEVEVYPEQTPTTLDPNGLRKGAPGRGSEQVFRKKRPTCMYFFRLFHTQKDKKTHRKPLVKFVPKRQKAVFGTILDPLPFNPPG